MPPVNAGRVVETLTGQVTSPGTAVSEGTVTFTIAGNSVTAHVDAQGRVIASLPLKSLAINSIQSISSRYSDAAGNFGPSFAGNGFTITPSSVLFPPSATAVTADGWQLAAADFFGDSPVIQMDQQSNATGFTYGAFTGQFVRDSHGGLLNVTIDGAPLFPGK